MSNISIVIADDHKIVRDGLRAILEEVSDIKIVAEAANGDEVLEYCQDDDEELPDLVLMDVDMPKMNGIIASKRLTENYNDIKILALTMMQEEEQIRDMLQAGSNGYLFKNSDMDELINAIRTIYSGKPYFSDEATYAVLNELTDENKSKNSPNTELTDRELEVLELICREYTNPEIAEELYISVRTVDAHRRNLLQKTGACNTAGLVRYAMEHQLLNS